MKTSDWDYGKYQQKAAKEFCADYVRDRTLKMIRKYAKGDLARQLAGELTKLTGDKIHLSDVWDLMEDIGIEVFAGAHPLGAWEGKNILKTLAKDDDDDDDIPF